MERERQRKEKMARQEGACLGQLYLGRDPGTQTWDKWSLGLTWVLKYFLDSNISDVKKKGLPGPPSASD